MISTELLPPQDIMAERSVLGACLIDREAIARVADMLPSADRYYRRAHQFIWTSMLAMYAKRVPIDLITLRDSMQKTGTLDEVGGTDYLVELTEAVPTAANVLHYAAIVANRWKRREYIQHGVRIIAAAHEDDAEVDAVVASAATDMLALQVDEDRGHKVQSIGEVVTEYAQMLDFGPTRLHNHRSTGFHSLDSKIGGYADSDVIVLGGGPGSGKTTFAMQSSWKVAKSGWLALYFSMELGRKQFARRMISFESMVPGHVIEYGPQDRFDAAMPHIIHGVATVAGLPLHVVFGRKSTQQVLTMAREIQARTGKKLGLLVIDRVEYLSDRDCASLEETKRIPILTPRVKGIATELDIPVKLLVQLSRQGRDGVPTMEAFRASGSIEQDCQTGLILRSDKQKERATIFVVKQNDGPTGACPEMVWSHRIPAFMEFETRYQEAS